MTIPEYEYHIYAKDVCLYNCLKEEEFKDRWKEINVLVGLIKTDYVEDDLSYVRVESSTVHESGDGEPDGSPSF